MESYSIQGVQYDNAKAGAEIAVQSFGDFKIFIRPTSGGFLPLVANFTSV